ncbi:MAG TPA: hypothetical protein VGD31_06145, partial [Sphingobacteriaceae bacterium]
CAGENLRLKFADDYQKDIRQNPEVDLRANIGDNEISRGITMRKSGVLKLTCHSMKDTDLLLTQVIA